ncbi:MAG TPA: hypothetical protein VL285_12245 [Bryobacteraceae bacterium]|nr:hypothetical protein [Bryobacteraceae bacterium]
MSRLGGLQDKGAPGIAKKRDAAGSRWKPFLRAVFAALVILYLFAFAGDGLRAYFTGDDLMNLYHYWSQPLGRILLESVVFFPADILRPLGALFYGPLFALFGLNPLPYRVVCMALLLINLGLLYVFCRRLSGSREAAALACLIGAYHANLGDLYYNSGTIYDLLCYTFFYLALIYYIGIRGRGAYPTLRQTAALTALYIAALGSKEMAATLPVIVAVYELVYHPPDSWKPGGLLRWSGRNMRFVIAAIPVTLAYIGSKVTGSNHIFANPAYRPHVTWNAFMTGWRHYLEPLFYNSLQFGRTRTIVLWIGLLILARLSRRRELLFAWGIIMAGVLPIIFIEPRGLYGIYLTLPAWYLFMATILTLARDQWVRRARSIPEWTGVEAGQLFLFLAALFLLSPLHRHQKALAPMSTTASEPVRLVQEQILNRYPTMPRGSGVLFLSDPLEPYDYTLTFLFRLHYRDKDLRVDRVKQLGAAPDAEAQKAYAHIFRYDGGVITALR